MLCSEFSSVYSCFNLVFKLTFPFIRAVTKGWELEISPVTMSMISYIHRKQREIEPKELPSCSISRLVITYTSQVKILLTAFF